MSLRNENVGGVDLPPEYCQYNDDGCEFGGSCLNCHLPICIYDEPGGKQRFLKHKRALEMARLFSNEGKSVKELAGIFNVSTRTVQRALKSVSGTARERERSLRGVIATRQSKTVHHE
jgi:AraC-like DNA-binding protein